MREINLEELKKLQIGVLDSVVEFCELQHIDYWLDGGTLLGAIRHGGYIPWDDDIDLGMLRPDFDRFIREFNGFNKRYVVKCIDTDSDFPYAYAKVLDTNTILYEPDLKGNKINVNIDIFVYDNAPSDVNKVKELFDKRDFYRKVNDKYATKREPSGNVIRRKLIKLIRTILLLLLPKNYFINKISTNAKKYNSVNTKLVGNFLGWARFCCRKEVLKNFIYHRFESKQYKVPVGYDEWLTSFYGDYMQIPPIEKRVSHHMFKAYMND